MAAKHNKNDKVSQLEAEVADLRRRLDRLAALEVSCRISEAREKAAHDFLSRVMDCASNAIFTQDPTGRFTRVNRAAEAMTGISRERLLGRHFSLVVPQEALPQVRADFASALEGRHTPRREISLPFPDGRQRHILYSMMPLVIQEEVVGVVVSAEDVTERKEMERRLRRLATRDHLTGVLNRGYFLDCLEKEVRRAHRYDQPLSLLMLDVDFFKRVNDTFGHPAGDQVLKELARLCQKQVREHDLVGRMGGEEFAIALVACDPERAGLVAERLRQEAALCLREVVSAPWPVTVSLGVAPLIPDEDVDHLFKRVDQALYVAKAAGRNRVRLAPAQ